MNWTLLPPWSQSVIAAGVALLLVLAAVRRWRERRGLAPLLVRAGVVGALLLVALNPQAFVPREKKTAPRLLVLVDTSASMATRDVEDNSRLGAALGVLTNAATLASLQRDFALEVRRFGKQAQRVDPATLHADDAREEASDLGGALMTAASEQGEAREQAGVVLISDGRATTPGALDAAQVALARSVPLWTWRLGGPVVRRDVRVETAAADTLAFSGAETELAATLHAEGYPNRSFRVELLNDGKPVESRDVLPDTNGVARIVFHVRAPASGEARFVVRAPPLPDEADASNNERPLFLRAVGEKVRVLVAEGQPHWDTKFLVQSLKRDARVELTAVYRLNAARHVALVSSNANETRVDRDLFPRDAAAMDQFDVIVLGREAESFFDASTEALLTEFVARRGGSLILARGKPYGGRFPALAKLEPLVWGSGATLQARFQPTDAGRESPVFDLGAAGALDPLLARLPALDQAAITLGEKPLAVPLATAGADGPVLVAYQRYGQGRVLSLNASGLWRWAFGGAGQAESEAAYHRFWVATLQWLLAGNQFLPGADVSLTSARRQYTSEQPLQFFIGTRNLDRVAYQPRLIIDGPSGRMEVEPRPRGEGYLAEVGPFPPGPCHITLKNNLRKPAEIKLDVDVVNASVEQRELSADPVLMKQLAAVSGGAEITGADLPRMAEVLRKWEAARELSHRQQPLWDRWWGLVGMCGLLGAEWWLRRKEGLL
jgi:hypothetical protein